MNTQCACCCIELKFSNDWETCKKHIGPATDSLTPITVNIKLDDNTTAIDFIEEHIPKLGLASIIEGGLFICGDCYSSVVTLHEFVNKIYDRRRENIVRNAADKVGAQVIKLDCSSNDEEFGVSDMSVGTCEGGIGILGTEVCVTANDFFSKNNEETKNITSGIVEDDIMEYKEEANDKVIKRLKWGDHGYSLKSEAVLEHCSNKTQSKTTKPHKMANKSNPRPVASETSRILQNRKIPKCKRISNKSHQLLTSNKTPIARTHQEILMEKYDPDWFLEDDTDRFKFGMMEDKQISVDDRNKDKQRLLTALKRRQYERVLQSAIQMCNDSTSFIFTHLMKMVSNEIKTILCSKILAITDDTQLTGVDLVDLADAVGVMAPITKSILTHLFPNRPNIPLIIIAMVVHNENCQHNLIQVLISITLWLAHTPVKVFQDLQRIGITVSKKTVKTYVHKLVPKSCDTRDLSPNEIAAVALLNKLTNGMKSFW